MLLSVLGPFRIRIRPQLTYLSRMSNPVFSFPQEQTCVRRACGCGGAGAPCRTATKPNPADPDDAPACRAGFRAVFALILTRRSIGTFYSAAVSIRGRSRRQIGMRDDPRSDLNRPDRGWSGRTMAAIIAILAVLGILFIWLRGVAREWPTHRGRPSARQHGRFLRLHRRLLHRLRQPHLQPDNDENAARGSDRPLAAYFTSVRPIVSSDHR